MPILDSKWEEGDFFNCVNVGVSVLVGESVRVLENVGVNDGEVVLVKVLVMVEV